MPERRRARRTTMLALALGLWSSAAGAELAVFTDGRIMKVEDAALAGDRIILTLGDGGELVVPALRVDRVVSDEVAPAEPLAVATAPSCETTWPSAAPELDTPFAGLISAAAEAADLHPVLLTALVRAESNFDPYAVSRVGAAGLTQLMPAAAADTGVENVFDPAENLRGGARHLRQLLDRFGSLPLALAAYNAGAATVERYGGIPPYRETRAYVARVLTAFCPDSS